MSEIVYRWGMRSNGTPIYASERRNGETHAGRHRYRPTCEMRPVCVTYNPETVVPKATVTPAEAGAAPKEALAGNSPALTPDPVAPEWTADYRPPPTHYDAGNGLDPWAVWDAFDLDRYVANAVKYLLRAGKKDIAPRLDDLKKARDYINKAIEREEQAGA